MQSIKHTQGTCVFFFRLDSSISCYRASAEDRTGRLCSSVPSVESRTCWACDRSRGSARPRATCRRRRSIRSYVAFHARSRRDDDAWAPSATAGRRAIFVDPFAGSPAVSSAFSGKSSRLGQKRIARTQHTFSIIAQSLKI